MYNNFINGCFSRICIKLFRLWVNGKRILVLQWCILFVIILVLFYFLIFRKAIFQDSKSDQKFHVALSIYSKLNTVCTLKRSFFDFLCSYKTHSTNFKKKIKMRNTPVQFLTIFGRNTNQSSFRISFFYEPTNFFRIFLKNIQTPKLNMHALFFFFSAKYFM